MAAWWIEVWWVELYSTIDLKHSVKTITYQTSFMLLHFSLTKKFLFYNDQTLLFKKSHHIVPPQHGTTRKNSPLFIAWASKGKAIHYFNSTWHKTAKINTHQNKNLREPFLLYISEFKSIPRGFIIISHNSFDMNNQK